MPPSTYKSDFLSGFKWTTIQQISVSLLTLLRLGILTRLLLEDTFGIYAVVLLIIGFTQVFSDLGLAVALFHKKNMSQLEYSTLYWINIAFNIILYLCLILSLPIILGYFQMNDLKSIIPIIGLNLIFTAFGKHHFVYAQKELKFNELAKILIGVNFIGVIIATILALLDFEIYALVYTSIFITFSTSICYFLLMRNKYPVALQFSFDSVRNTFKIGMFQSGAQIMDYVSSQMDIIILSRLLPENELGIYNILKQFGLKIYSVTNAMVSKVAVPLFSDFNDNEELLKSRFIIVLEKVSFVNMLIYANVASASFYTLNFIFGDSYSAYFMEFELFSLLFYFTSLISIAGVLIVSKGKTKIGLFWTIIRGVLSSILIILFGLNFGMIGVIGGLCTFATLGFLLHFYIVVNNIQSNISIREYLSAVKINVIIGLAIFLFSKTLIFIIPIDGLIPDLAIILFVNILLVLSFRRKLLNEFLGLINAKFQV